MTTPNLTLPDFLLARIEADEREANYLRNVGVQGTQYGSINGALGNLLERVLADCKAKRRIIELHDPDHDPCDAHDASFESVSCDTLLHLAQPYADHADFRDEWRI